MSVSSLGIGSGIDLQGLLDGLMKVEAVQQDKLKTRVSSTQSKISTYQALNAKFLALKTASEEINLSSFWKLNKAASSSENVVATANGNAIASNISFKVMNLASAHVMASSGTVPGLDSVVGSGTHTVGNYSALGITSATPSGLGAGKHSLEVTQASAAATIKGGAVGGSVTINASNNTVNMNINGAARSFTLSNGTYTRQQLVDELNTRGSGQFSAQLNADNTISFSTLNEGSQARMRFTGGNGLATLGVASSGTNTMGTDGIIKLDGVTNTVTNTAIATTLNSTSGTLAVNFGTNGVNTGTGSLEIYDYGDGKLSTIVNNINSLNGSMSASAVQVAPGQYKLQIAAKETGTANALTIDPNAFSSLGTLQTVTAATDAVLQVGTGPGAYNITSSKNTVSDAIPGVTLNLRTADPTKDVNVSVTGDVDGLADKVAKLVAAANDALAHIKTNSTYDVANKRGGALQGNSVARTLSQSLFSQAMNPVGGTSLVTASSVGIKTDASGAITFDREAFKAAYARNPEAVASMFVEGGTNGIAGTPTNPGIAERLATLAKAATNAVDGTITTGITGLNKTVDDLNKQITAWDNRLETRRLNLQRQFSALDTAIAGFKNQQSWLSGQIAKLQG